jgi:RecJ-like exonuclease
VSLPGFVPCPACAGQGEFVTSHRADCPDCDGQGEVTPELVRAWRLVRTATDAVRAEIDRRRAAVDGQVWAEARAGIKVLTDLMVKEQEACRLKRREASTRSTPSSGP